MSEKKRITNEDLHTEIKRLRMEIGSTVLVAFLSGYVNAAIEAQIPARRVLEFVKLILEGRVSNIESSLSDISPEGLDCINKLFAEELHELLTAKEEDHGESDFSQGAI